MIDALVIEPFSQITGDVAGTVVRRQSWSVPNVDLIQPEACEAIPSELHEPFLLAILYLIDEMKLDQTPLLDKLKCTVRLTG